MKGKQVYIICMLLLLSIFRGGELLLAQEVQKRHVFIQTDGLSYITGEQVWCSVRVTDPVTGRPASAGHMICATLLDHNGTALVQVRFAAENGIAAGHIPLPASLVSGIYLLTAITGDSSLSAPCIPILVINPNKAPVQLKDSIVALHTAVNEGNSNNMQIRPDKMQYGKRERINIGIDAGDTGISQLTMRIRRSDALENFADSLLSGLDIGAVLAGNPELSSWEGQLLQAKVYPANSTSPAPNIRVFVSVIGTEARIGEAVSDVNGEVKFLLPVIYADAQLVFIPVHDGAAGYRVEFNQDPQEKIPAIQMPPLVLPGYLAGPIRDRVIEAQAQLGFRPEEKTRLLISNPDTTDFYGRPDKRYMLDDYTRFPDMEEIITEFVTEVRIRRNPESVELQVSNAPYKKFFEEPALVLIDGVPVTDIVQLLDLDPLKLQSIDIISRRFFMGSRSYPGIIHYKSYQGNLGGYTLPPDAAVYGFEGVQLQKEYLTPDYSSQSDRRIPDFRNLLYWSPALLTDKNGRKHIELFSGDLEGSYKVSIQGVSANGSPKNGSANIYIK